LDLAERLRVLRTGFTRTFWVANVLELFERLAFYGSKAVLAVYLNRAVGLGTTGNDLVGVYGGLVFGLPIFAGVVVDRFGFKRSLLACFSIFCAGYTLIGLAGMPAGQPLVDALGKKGFVILALVVTAVGGSLIKPCVVGTVARTTTEETKSFGFSIYYTLVNFGGFLGPILASEVRTRWGIAEVLLMSAAVSAALVLGTLLFYREPVGPREGRTFAKVVADAALVFRNVRFIAFLVVFSGFWIMFWQVFYSLPFYVTDVLKIARFELLETVDALGIIFLSVPATALMKKVRPIRAMAGGFAVASASWLIIAFSRSWQGVVAAMLLFALGESMQAPRFYEYVADLAPKEQTGTYMGFAFLPVAIGAFAAGPLSGYLVEHYLKGPDPGGMWVLLSAIGFTATAGMLLYDRFLAPRKAAA
jgi:proton-dependent oligopeptide transporter, POT family